MPTSRPSAVSRFFVLVFALLLAAPLSAIPARPVKAAGNSALQLSGTTQYATLGTAAQLRSATFTVELWFKRTGVGLGTSTGSGGVTAIPLIAKGRAEDENAAMDVNYFFGIDSTSGKLVADFEEAQVAQGGTSPSLNHPITGTRVIAADSTWHHAAATYDGTAWNLYLDGSLDGTLAVNRVANSATNALTAIGSALRTTAVADGFFAGVIDEVRIWNSARSLAQINATKNTEITSAQSGLLGAWNLNEGTGTSLADSSGNGTTGATLPLIGPPAWTAGFVVPMGNRAPDAPTLGAPTDGATGIGTSPTLSVGVSDPDASPLTVTFYGRPYASGVFTQVAQSTGVASGSTATATWANLDAGQEFEWYATVSDGTATTTGPTWTFHTAAGPDPVFVGAGDIAACTTTNDTLTGNVVQGIDGTVFTTGDDVYYNGTAADYANCYATTPWGSPSVLSRTRPIAGNHDWDTGARNNLDPYFAYFGSNATDAGGKSYYSYDIDSHWHVVNLESECALVGGCGPGSAQELWLKADLAANSTKNVIALVHKPRYSSGTTSLQELQALWDDLYGAGVDIVLAGHDHVYERLTPIKSGATLASQPVADPLYGIRVFTVGTGGESHHSLGSLLTTSQVANATTFGVFKLTLHELGYDWKFFPVSGGTFTDSGYGSVHGAPGGTPMGAYGIDLGSESAYVDLNNPTKLGLDRFTLETWFKRTGNGTGVDTSAADGGGLLGAIPLITKGRGEGDGSNVDMNYFLGISSTGKLAADFEEGPSTGGTLGLNHALLGATTITSNVWHHAAATYDGQTWNLYVDGNLDGTLTLPVARPPRSNSLQEAGLGTALNSIGVAAGHFTGILDEVRIWDHARTKAEIVADVNHELTTGTGLVARWGMGEGTGTAVDDSITTPPAANGTITGTGSVWLAGAPFNLVTNRAPVADAQSVMTAEDTAKAITLVASDPDGDGLIWTVGTPSHGTFAGTAPDLTYTPGSDYHGPDSFTFSVSDGTLSSNTATVSITVTPVNDAPTVTNPGAQSSAEGATIDLQVSAADVDGDSLTYGATGLPAGLSISSTGRIMGTLDFTAAGSHDVTVTVSDGTLSAHAGFAWTVSNTNRAPVANAQSVTTAEDAPAAITLAGSDPDSDPLVYAIATGPSGGSLDLVGAGVYTYTPNANYNGSDSFTFTASDPGGTSSPATVTITVAAVNDAPVLNAIGDKSIAELVELTFTANATDIDSSALVFGLVGEPAGATIDASTGVFTWTPTEAQGSGEYTFNVFVRDGAPDSAMTRSDVETITITATEVNVAPVFASIGNKTVAEGTPLDIALSASDADLPLQLLRFSATGASYTSVTGSTLHIAPDFGDVSDDVTVCVSDDVAEPVCETITINVSNTNRPPVADSQSVTTAEDTANDITLLATDPDGDGPSYTVVSQPAHGTLFGTAPALTYTPAANYHGDDSFTFTASDGSLDSNVATVSITVTPVNDAPVCANGGSTTAEDTATGGTLGCTDADSVSLTYAIVTAPVHGALGGTMPAFTYTPTADANGLDTITFKATDGTADSNTATWTLTVLAVNDPPTVTPQSVETAEDTAKAIVLTGGDPDGDPLAFAIDSPPAHGTMTGTTPNLTYTPDANWHGDDSFTFKANDGTADSSSATLSITVTAVNDAPVLTNPGPQSGERNALATLQGTAIDVDGDTLTFAASGLPAGLSIDSSSGIVSGTIAVSSAVGPYAASISVSDGHGGSDTESFTWTVVDETAPAAPAGFTATPGDGQVTLVWSASSAPDFAGYNLYRATTPGVAISSTKVNSALLTEPTFTDAGRTNGTTYYYAVTAADTAGNESALSGERSARPVPRVANRALDLGSTGAYVTFGDPSKLDLATFTIETWFKRTGAGVSGTTGSDGIPNFIPLVTHGGPQADGSNVDEDWLLGIDDATDVLAADFEEWGPTSAAPAGANHPVRGTTVIANNVWYHASATYDGTTWRLYVNGSLEASLAVNKQPRYDTTQHAGLGAMLNSSGTTSNSAARFAGVLDEVRVWDHARTRAELVADVNRELTTGTGLVARWGLDEGYGVIVDDAVGTVANGTITGTGTTWSSPAPLDAAPDVTPPAAPAELTATAGDGQVALAWTASTATDTAGYNLYRSTTSPVTTGSTRVNTSLLPGIAFTDTGRTNGTTYYYVVTTVDRQGNESDLSAERNSTPAVVIDLTPPAVPGGLTATAGDGQVVLAWTANTEPDLEGYNLYRSTTSPVLKGTPANGSTLLADPAYTDTGSTNGTTYYYAVTAVDTSGNESGLSTEKSATPRATSTANRGLDLGPTAYVTFGDPAKLDLGTFTIETWFKRDGAGTAASSGSNGVSMIPLLAHGSPEADGSNLDENWILGINGTTGTLAADFEDMASGSNHPVSGSTVITSNVWHHAVATYDGTTWRLYLDGNLDATLTANASPRSDSLQPASLGTMITSTGATNGHFDGVLDEVRVWSRALSGSEIVANINSELTSGSGLVARWGLSERTGTAVGDAIVPAANGTIMGTGTAWVPGAPLTLLVNTAPVVNAGGDQSTAAGAPASLTGTVSDDGCPEPTTLATTWSMVTGPGNVTFGDASALTTTATFSTDGTYILRLTADDSALTTTDDVTITVTTAAADPVIVGAGDIGQCGGRQADTAALINALPDATVFTTGDNAYPAGTADELASCYDPSWGVFKARTWPSIGNHDWANASSGYYPYFGARAPGAPGGWYSYDIGTRWHAIVLNSETNYTAGSAQEQWLRADLAANAAKNVVAYWHKPRFDSGATHGTEDNAEAIWRALYEYGADVVLNGHEHSYERFAPQTPDGVADASYGIREFVVGTGGASLYGVGSLDANSQVFNGSTYGVLKLTLHDASYDWQFIPVAGQTFADSGTQAVHPAPNSPTTNLGLDLGTGSAYVTFGDAAKLDLTAFTVETWFKREGAGAGVATTGGTGGLTSAVPLLAKGASESDSTCNLNLAWFLGIDTATGGLAADFETGIGGANHGLVARTPVSGNAWHHAALSLDGSTLKLYLDGVLDGSLATTDLPCADSIQPAALGASITSTGTVGGHFDGVLDEARVWNRALSAIEIAASINSELTSGSGLIARWGLNEGAGSAVADSVVPVANGTITGAGTSWVPGAPLNLVINRAPAAPVLVSPANGGSGVSTAPTLSVTAADPDGGNLDVTFYGRTTAGTGASTPFTFVVIPDTQTYSLSDAAATTYFNGQTQWIADQRASRNIVFAAHMGDLTENGTVAAEWSRASAAMAILDSAGVPYSVVAGNHDGWASDYPTYKASFPVTRYAGKSWYGGYLGYPGDGIADFAQDRGNLDSYQLFSADGLDFIVLNLELDSPPAYHVADWANAVLAAYPNRRAIVTTHAFLNQSSVRPTSPYTRASDGIGAETVWQTVIRNNCNVFLVLDGNYPGEGRLTSTNACGQPVHQVLQDYQSYANGGNGFLRYFTFDPANNRISAFTYSPPLNQFETDASSQFTLAYDMGGGSPFQVIGTDTVASGGTASVTWSARPSGIDHEWYATVSDGIATTTGTHWTFQTASTPDTTPPTVTVPSDRTIEAASAAGAVATFSATAIDDRDGTIAPACSPSSGTTFPLGATTVVCTATDQASNTGSASFKITVADTTAPVISGTPSDILRATTDPAGVAVSYGTPTATDAVSGTVPVSCIPASGQVFPVGATRVTCTATDGASNASTTGFNIVVSINQPPTVTVPADITKEATGPSGAVVTFTAAATDPEDGILTPSCAPASGTVFVLGVTDVTCRATDSAGQMSSKSFKVTVQDLTPPTITGTPADIARTTTNAAGIVVTYPAPTASDLVSGSVAVACVPSSGSTFPVGQTTVTCSAIDGAGNTSTTSFKVTITHDAPPSAPTGLGADQTSEAIALHWTANAETDVSGYNVYRSKDAGAWTKVNSTLVSPTSFTDASAPLGSLHYRIRAIDAAGGESADSAIVAVARKIAFRAAASVTTTNSASVTVGRPAGLALGDVLIASITVTGTPSVTPPAGWTLVRDTASGSSLSQLLYCKTAGASEPASYRWSIGAKAAAVGSVAAYMGVDTTNPVDASGSASGASGSAAAPTLTTTADGDLLVVAFGASTASTFTPPSGMLEQLDLSGGTGKARVSGELADEVLGSAGPTGPRTVTPSWSGPWVAQLVALRPAGAPIAPTVPGAPSGLTAAPGDASITLAWTAPATDGGAPITGFNVYRGPTPGGEEAAPVATVTAPTFTDTGRTNGATYYYTVKAVNSEGPGPASNETSATPATLPETPTGLAAAGGAGSVHLTWVAPANGGSSITGYKVYRSTATGAESLLTTVGNVTSWDDPVAAGTSYYKVSAVNAVGEGPLSSETSATATEPTAPTAPRNLVGAPASGKGGVQLTWSAPASNGGSAITGYKVYRRTTSGEVTLVATLGVVTTYKDTGTARGGTYYYRITALNAMGESPISNEAIAKAK